jgi:hypothetical protein
MSQHKLRYPDLPLIDIQKEYYNKVRKLYEEECMQALIEVIGEEHFTKNKQYSYYFIIWLNGSNLEVYTGITIFKQEQLDIEIRYWIASEHNNNGFPDESLTCISVNNEKELVHNENKDNISILKHKVLDNNGRYFKKRITITPGMKISDLVIREHS